MCILCTSGIDHRHSYIVGVVPGLLLLLFGLLLWGFFVGFLWVLFSSFICLFVVVCYWGFGCLFFAFTCNK